MTKEVELYYHISGNGDGSASLELHKTKKQAEKADEEQHEWGGFAESTVSSIKLKIENNKIYRQEFTEVKGKWQYIWIEIK